MYQLYDADVLRTLTHRLLTAAGAGNAEAQLVTDELIEASLMGLDSHGLLRAAQYVRQLQDGSIRPNVTPTVVKKIGSATIVDGGNGFGMVTAGFMTDHVTELARSHQIAAAVSRHTHHVGRLGAYPQRLAERGLFGFAVANASRQGHYVTPWGGTSGRLGTNPLAYGCPTGDGMPIVLDMSTSAIAEGAVRAASQRGDHVPEGCILDPEGRPTTDPHEFYRDQWGAILPFGGPQGYKGFGLALMVELLGSTLAGVPLTKDGESDTYINGFFLLAIDPDGFCGRQRFVELVSELAAYIRSAPPAPGTNGVVLAGDRDWTTRRQRLAEGIPVADGTWRELVAAGKSVGLSASAMADMVRGSPGEGADGVRFWYKGEDG